MRCKAHEPRLEEGKPSASPGLLGLERPKRAAGFRSVGDPLARGLADPVRPPHLAPASSLSPALAAPLTHFLCIEAETSPASSALDAPWGPAGAAPPGLSWPSQPPDPSQGFRLPGSQASVHREGAALTQLQVWGWFGGQGHVPPSLQLCLPSCSSLMLLSFCPSSHPAPTGCPSSTVVDGRVLGGPQSWGLVAQREHRAGAHSQKHKFQTDPTPKCSLVCGASQLQGCSGLCFLWLPLGTRGPLATGRRSCGWGRGRVRP